MMLTRRRMKITAACGAAFLLATAGVSSVFGTGKRAATPPAGDYSCLKSRLAFSPVQGPAGPLMLLQYDPSVLGTLKLDGRGQYRTRHSAGRYSYTASTGRFSFVSGPLKGWPVVFEVRKGAPRLRLASTMKGRVGAVGEHVCRWRGSGRFADTPISSSGGESENEASRGPKNGGLKGTLTFRESWGSDRIVDVDLTTGRVRSRFAGSQPFRSRSGETVFINDHGQLVIAGSNGTTAATIPTPGRVDMPVLSPDGSKVAFHYEPVYYSSKVIVVTRDGKQVAEFKGVTEPNWTPDGRLIVANSRATEKSTAAILLSDAGLTSLARIDPNLDNASAPAVSPDGKRVAFVHHGHIWVMNLDGSGLKQVTTSDGGEERPSWSPDGRAITAVTKTYSVVLVVPLASGKIIQVTNEKGKSMQSSGRITWR